MGKNKTNAQSVSHAFRRTCKTAGDGEGSEPDSDGLIAGPVEEEEVHEEAAMVP